MEGKIVQVLRTVRQGVSKKTNKPYEILLVLLESGEEVEVFGPAKQGDLVTNITYNEQYGKTQGVVTRPDKQEEIMQAIRVISKQMEEIKQIFNSVSGSQGALTAVPTPSVKKDEEPSSVRATQVSGNPQTATDLAQKLKNWPPPSDADREPNLDVGDPFDDI